MQFVAKARYVHYSPYKLRMIVDVIRGKNVVYALNWLNACKMQRVVPIKKVVASAVANASHLKNVSASDLFIKEIKVDEGPSQKYFKPGAMGRTSVYKRRSSHMSVILETVAGKEV